MNYHMQKQTTKLPWGTERNDPSRKKANRLVCIYLS